MTLSHAALNKDAATQGNYHEQLQVQKAKGREEFKDRGDGEQSMIRYSDGRLVASGDTIKYHNKKGELAANLPIHTSAQDCAQDYVGETTLTQSIWQAQFDNMVAGRAGGMTPWPVIRLKHGWALNAGHLYLPVAISTGLGLEAGVEWTITFRFKKEESYKAFPCLFSDKAEEVKGIAIELQAAPADQQEGRTPSPWVRYLNTAVRPSANWIELHGMVAKAFKKLPLLEATTSSACPSVLASNTSSASPSELA